MRRLALTHGRALLAYAAVAVFFNWPLPLHLGSRLTGQITGDTGVYVWNTWHFRHAILTHRNPLFTNQILSLTAPVDLSLHNYTLFANILTFPLVPFFGVTAAFNVVYLAIVTLTAWAMFVLARHVIGRTAEAWLAGVLFGFSPFLVARSEAHFSLVAAAPLPIFMLALMRLSRRLDARDAAIAGATVAWAAMCDVYYGVFCVLIAACTAAARYVRLRRGSPQLRPGRKERIIDTLIVCMLAVVVAILVTHGTELHVGGLTIAMRSLYTPVLMLTVLVITRVVLALHLEATLRRLPPARVAGGLIAVAGLTCGVMLSPVLFALRARLSDGGTLHGPVFWRNSPSGVDVLAFFTPNPNQPLFGTLWRDWLTGQPGGYVENVASLTIVGVVVVAIAVWRYRYRPPSMWLTLTVVFAILALGPFVHVGGANTFVPGPWALLRYVPIVSATRTPARFAVVAMMGFSILFGLALARITSRHPSHRRALLLVTGLALALELSPFPRTTYTAVVPEIYARIADDPRDVRVLELPFGIRDGEFSEGNFNASAQFYQTYHKKRLIGGYLSRISRAEVERQRQSQTVRGLMRLSAGEELPAERLAELTARGPAFVQRVRLGYVIVHARRAPGALRDFAIAAFRLVKVDERDGEELYVPMGSAQAWLDSPDPR